MKQTNDLMHHGLNGQPETTISVTRPQRRLPQTLKTTILLLALLMGWGSRAVAQDVATLWTGSTTDQITLSGETLYNGLSSIEDKSKAYLNVYTSDNGLSTFYADWGNNTGLQSGATSIPQGQYYISSLSCYSIPFSDFKSDFVNRANQWTAPFFIRNSVSPITKITYYVEPEVADAFVNEAASGCDPTSGSEKLSRDLASTSIDLSGAKLTGVKYVRVYLANANGSAVDPTGLLSVSYGGTAGVQAGTNVKNGLYVYDGGNDLTLSNISVTLNAGAGNFTNYKIVCLLSNNISTATPSDGTTPLTQEPKWQEEYTYTFTYPSNAVVVPFSLEDANSVSVNLNIQSRILSDLGVSSVSDIASNLYSRWYVQHKTTKEKQPLTVVDSNPSQGSTWLLQVPSTYDWPLVDGNYVHFYTGLHRSASDITNWAFGNYLGKVTVFAPNTSGTNISDYSDYQIVCEVSGHYTALDGSIPDPDVMYVWSIVPNVQFEGDPNTNAVSDATGTQKVNAAAASVSLDLTGKALAHAKVASADVRYARFYLTDASGTIVDPTGKLEVKYNGTTISANCPKTNQGFYVYTGSTLDKTKFTVTLTAPNAYTNYKVVALFAVNPLQNIIATGTTVTEEPDYDLLYTYSFEEYQFEYTGTITNTYAVSQQLADRTAASEQEVELNWSLATSLPSAAQYARFYVVDSSNQPVDPTQDAHKLTITDATGTVCSPATLGYYVYTGSNLTLSDITVTLTSNESVLPYKVVCKLSTTGDNIENDGNTVYEEPDLDYQYTYSFTKPDPTTQPLTGTIDWGSEMTADASTTDITTEWETSWAELSQGYYVRWYVVDDSNNRQSLASGSSAQSGTWVFNQNAYSVSSNEAVKSGSGDFTQANWNDIWGKPTIYAPTDQTYAALHGYKVICEVAATATSTPFVRYTFSFTKDFLGELKSGVTATTQVETLANATDVSCTLSNITLPSGTKYVRFYLTTSSDDPANPTGLLTFTGATPGTVSGHPEYGYYIYNVGGITAPTVTLTLTDATLNLYKVVMVTSADNAVTESGAVVNEPDWDTQTTWSFKYPVQHTEKTGEVEWSPVSMTVPLDIDDLKGDGYSASLTDYHVVWTVNVDGTEATPATGTARQEGQWTMSVSGNNATFYAPTGQTFADMSDVTFVARLYETATGENDADKSLTYTVGIDRSEFLGQHKSTFDTDDETVELDDADATSVTVPLSHAVFSGAKYARVWLTQGGTAVNPSGKLALPTGMTAFGTNHDAVYGYFLYKESGISLSDVTLTLAAGTYPDYQVHVALSVDAPIGYTDFARADAPRRAPSLNAYEPDYDYEYIFSFVSPYERKRLNLISDTQLGDNSLTLNIWGKILEYFGKADAAAFFASASYTKWYIEDANGNRQPLHYNSNAENGIWTTTKNNQSTGTVANNEFYWKSADGWNQWYHFVGQLDFKTPSGTTLEDFRGYRFLCEVSDEFDGTNAVPKVIFWIPIPDYFVGTLKTGTPVEETVIVEEDTKTYTLTELQTQYEAFVTSKSVTNTDQVYLRLYAANINGTLADDQSVYTFVNLPADFVHIDQGWAYLGPALTTEQITALAGVTVTSTQNLYDTGRKVGLVMAKAPFDERFYPTDAATVEAILNEPKWDYQYLLRFDQFLTTDGPTMIEETVTVRPGTADAEGRYTFSIANIAALSAGAKGFDAKYMRWYLADSNGNIINPQTYTQYTWGPAGNQTRWFITDVNPTAGMTHDHNDINRASDNALKYGQMWWYTNDNTVEFDDLSFKVTTPMIGGGWGGYYHDDLQNYQVVVYLSDNDDASMMTETISTGEPGPAGTTTTVTKEPTPDYKITIKFNSFFGDLATDATQVEQTFRQPLEDWNEACDDGAREYIISFDYTAKTVTMEKADGSGTSMTKNMTDEEYAFWSTFTDGTGTVPYERNFYFRWFLRNKATGEVAQIQNSIVSAPGGSALQDVIQYNANTWMGQTTYYRVADRAPGSKYFCNYFTDQGKDLPTLLRVKIDGSPAGGDGCFSLTEYDLVLLLNSTEKGDGEQATPWGETQHYCLVREPATFDLQYTFHFTTDFEADNIDDPSLKTKYKTLIYDPVTRSATPTILNNWPEVVAALPSSRDEFAEKGYVRWYLVSKATGQPIPMGGLTTNPADAYTSLGNQYGYYRYKFDATNLQYQNNGANHQYDPTITLPEGVRYQDVRIVGVVTTLTEPQDDNENLPKDLPAREPRQMQVKYVYDLVLEETLRDHQPFIHYHGIHYPEYHRSFEDSREFIGPGQPQDLPAEGTAAAGIIERVWDYGKNAIYNPADNSYAANRTYYKSHDGPEVVDPNDAASLLANSPDYTTRNIRQKTHTKEYNYYLLLADGEREALKLPYQDYLGGGNDTEPMAYIRWYDWKTDKNSEYLTPSGDADSRLIRLMSTEGGADPVDRGWYNIMLNANPTRTNVGIDFVAPEGFSNMTEEIVIACDVSRYMDGLDDSKQYLVHEPTLSMRYIYHILPAKVLADKMVAGANEYFNPVMKTLVETPGTETLQFADIDNYEKTFHLMEYNGRTVVSVVGSGNPATPALGHFSLRTTLTELDHYYVNVNGELKPCNNMQWYAYYEYEGKLYRHKVPMVKTSWTDTDADILSANEKKYGAEYHREDARLAIFETADLCGQYERVRNPEEKLPFTIQPGQFIHLVGCLGYDDGGGNITEVPTVSTELFLVDAAPQALGTESFARTDYSMSSTYKKAAELNFDDFFDDPTTRYDKPLNSFDNYAKIPMLFADAQYGFCYPRLYGQCATDWYLLNGHWEGFGFAPLHGDYTLLKSMNMPGVSQTRGETFDAARYQQAMYTTWYTTTPLYDVGHERASGKEDSDTQDYGSFLYVDAAEQSRTIGRLEFDAQLCSGAEIYYTAYIADMTDAVRYGTDIPNTTPQVRFRVYTYNTYSGYPLGTVSGDELLPGYTTQQTLPAISFVTGDIATEGATDKGKWYQVYGYCNLPSEDRAFLDGAQRHFYVEVDNYCENTYGADYAVDQVTFYTSSARIRIAQISDVCDDEKGVKMRITALASALLPHFGKGQDREIFYRIYPYSHDENKTDLEADEAITGQNVYCHEHATDDGDRGNLYGAVPFHVGYNDQATYESNYDQKLYDSLEALLEAKKDQAEYLPKYGFYKDGDEVYYLLDERYFELTPGQEYFVSLYTLGSYKPGGLDGWGNPYGNHTCTAYSNNIMPRTMFIELTEDSEVSEGIVDMGCGHTTATKDFGVRVRYPLESGGYQTYTNLPFDFFLGTKTDIDEAYLKDEHGDPVMEDYTDKNGQPAQRRIRLKDALEHFRSLMDGSSYKYPGAYTTVPTDYASEDEHEGRYYQILKEYVEEEQLLRLEATSKFTNTFTLAAGTTEVVDVAYLALPLYPQIDEDKEICSPITMIFHLDPTGGAPLMELGFDDVKYPASYKKRGVRVGLEQLAMMRDEGYMLHIPISNYYDKKKKEDPNALYFDSPLLTLRATNDPEYLNADGTITPEANNLIVTKIVEPGTDGSSNEGDDGTGVYVSNSRMYLPLSFTQDSEHPENYVTFKEGYWYEVSTSYYDPVADAEDYQDGQKCLADLFIVFKVVPEFATWDAQAIGSTHLYNVSWHNDDNWKRSTRDQLYKDVNGNSRTQNTNTAGHPAGYDNDGEGSLAALTGTLYEANPNPGFVPMKFTYVTLLTGNHAPSLINEAHTTTGSVQTGGYLIDPNQTELMSDTSPVDNKESSKATDDIRYDMLVRYGPNAHGGEGCFGHRSKTKGTDGKWGWRDDRRTDMTTFNENHKAFDVEKFYGNICKEIYFKPEAELLRQMRLTYEKAWVEKELVANTWYLAASPLKSTYAGDMYVPTSMSDLSMETPAEKAGRQMTEAFQPISFSLTANTVTNGTATSTPAYSRTKYPIYQRSWNTSGSRVYTKTNDARATDYSANLGYTSVSEQILEWSHTYNDVKVPYSTATTTNGSTTQASVASGFSIRANRKVQKDGSDSDVPALIRLPKADATYDYYDWSDQNEASGDNAFSKLTKTVSKPDVTLTNSFNGTTWDYNEPSQYRFVTDDASKDKSTQGAMEFSLSNLQVQGDYVLVGNPHVASLDMGEFFGGNPDLTHTGDNPFAVGTSNYSYWTYEGGQLKAFLVTKTNTLVDKETETGTTQVIEPSYAISSDGNDVVGIIRPTQAFFVKKGSADKIYFTRNMTIDGNFPTAADQTDGGSRLLRLRAASAEGASSAVVRISDAAADGYFEGEDVETLFDSNLAQVPMVYTVADGQAVSIDQRSSLDVLPFGVVQAKDEPVQVTVTSHPSPLTSHLYFIDALTCEQTMLTDSTTLTVQPNDYGRYFISATAIQSESVAEQDIIISVRQQEVTVTAFGGRLSMVRATTLNGITAFNSAKGDLQSPTQCKFQLAKGVYIIQARTKGGQERQLKVIVE